jgi:NADH-quinone oxidoreductase subunit E
MQTQVQQHEDTSVMRKFQAVCRILDRHAYDREKLIPILQAVQDEYRYLPEDVMTFIATSLNISPARVFGVATFYAHFALEPKGKYVIKVCDGTACHVKGSMKVHDVLKKKLSLKEDQKTTADLLFTLETVSCLGACGLAPVMVINDEVYGQITSERANAVLDEIIARETAGGTAA